MSTPPDAVPQVLDNARLADYRAQLDDLRRELAEVNSRHTSEHPKVKKVQAEIEQLESTLKKERDRILTLIRNECQSELTRENLRPSAPVSRPGLAEIPRRNPNAEAANPAIGTVSTKVTTRPFLRWEIPDEQVVVDVHLNVMERLEREVASSYPSMTAGILLGKIDRGRNLTVTIEHCERITGENSADGSPFGDSQLEKVQLNRWKRGTNLMSLLGGYRSSAGGEAVLTADDLAALKMIARSDAEAKDLRLGRPRTLAPISTLREQGSEGPTVFLLIESADRAAHTAVVYLVRDDKLPLQSSPIPLNRAELSMPEPFANRTPKTSGSPVIEEFEERAQGRKKTSQPVSHRALIALAALVLTLATAWTLFLRRSATPGRATDYSTINSDSRLNLRLDRSGTGWQLSWNADAPIFSKASKGRLLVRDGTFQETIDLGTADLKGRTVVYTPLSDDVVLQLEVDPDDGSEPVTESVRIVGGVASSTSSDSLVSPAGADFSRPSAFPTPRKPEAAFEPLLKKSVPDQSVSKPQPAQDSASASPQKRSSAVALPIVQSPAPATSSRAPFAAESRPAMKGPASVASNEAPRLAPSSVSSAFALTRPAEPERVPIIAAPVKPSSMRAKTAPRPGFIEPAQLLSVKNPAYPPLAKEQGISGTVEVHFRINTSGEVYDVSVSKGPTMLGDAAVEAVRDRHYRAAMVGGIPVETDGTAVFVFKLN